MIAVNTIREQPHYRRAAFDIGLQHLGYTMVKDGKPTGPTDLILLWNLHGGNEQRRDEWERQGGTALIVENGYIGKDAEGRQLYAISVHAHNGAGWFPQGPEDRFSALGIELAPWRGDSGHILVAGQRGIGSRLMASPHGWEDKTAHLLKAMGHKELLIRRHPGRFQPPTTLEADLACARLCAIWSSGSGVRALTMGVPVVHWAPHWICSGSAGRRPEAIAAPVRDDSRRLAALQHMAHGQWTVAEIEAGLPFERILSNLGSAKW
jgi:hypothetical protein